MKSMVPKHTVRCVWIAAVAGATVFWPESAAAVVDPVSNWNSIAVKAILTAGQGAVPESRTLAIVQVAIHDTLNAIDSRYERYAFTGDAQVGASVDAAIAASARDALVGAIAVGALPFPGFGTPATQALAVGQIDAEYAAALAGIRDGPSKSDGIAIGQAAAATIVALRNTDHATTLVTYTPGTGPGSWQPTPNPVPFDPPAAADNLPAALPGWGQVTPFVLRRSNQFEPNGPPHLSTKRYARDYNEVKAIGEKNSATRTAEQTSIARFWYEPSPAVWSRIARVVAQSRGLDSCGHGASARARQPCDGRWVYRRIRDKVPLQFLAAGDRDPRRRHGRKRCDGRGSDVVDVTEHSEYSRLHLDPQHPRRCRFQGAASVLP